MYLCDLPYCAAAFSKCPSVLRFLNTEVNWTYTREPPILDTSHILKFFFLVFIVFTQSSIQTPIVVRCNPAAVLLIPLVCVRHNFICMEVQNSCSEDMLVNQALGLHNFYLLWDSISPSTRNTMFNGSAWCALVKQPAVAGDFGCYHRRGVHDGHSHGAQHWDLFYRPRRLCGGSQVSLTDLTSRPIILAGSSCESMFGV